MGNKFGWHSGVLTCKDAKIQGDLYVQDDLVFSDVSAGTLGVTGGIDMTGTTSAIGIDMSGGTYSTGAIRIGDDVKLIFGAGNDASFEFDENGTDNLRYDGLDMVFDTATKLLFRDSALSINSSADGQLDIAADVTFSVVAPAIKLDGAVTFDDDGTLTDVSDVLTITQDTITLAGATAINLDGDTTITGAIVMDSAETTGFSITGATTTGISITGSATDGININTGTFTNAINIEGGTISKAIRMGSYSSRLTAISGATSEICTIGLSGDEDDFYIGYGSYIRTTAEDGKGFGASLLVEATNTTGTPTIQGMQSMAFLGSVGGSEAAILKTRGGDTTAGMTAGWFKIGCNTNCSLASGSYSSVIWLDSQLHGSGNLSGTHYHIFCSTDNIQTSVLGFNGTGGYTNFIHTDSDANKTPFDGGSVATNTGASTGSIKISLNGTSYLIPYFTA